MLFLKISAFIKFYLKKFAFNFVSYTSFGQFFVYNGFAFMF